MQHDEAIRVFDRVPGLPNDVRQAFNRILDDHNIERMGRIELIAERDQLRAELASAKEEQIATLAELQSFREHTTALAADNQRLRKALEDAFGGAARQLAEPRNHDDDQYALTAIATTCELALAATPSQSLAAHDAALLREVAKLMDPDGGCYEALLSEADRIEQEAQRGQAGA